ncbi:MAG TPA: hypothetical protein ENH91_02730 [Leeuwenhoekiella sp.]|nr:hypothetical protein [Leeuwenhoekiella sp.]
MYYPYLRGRQFELIALREYSDIRGDKNNIIPIIEPVKKSFNSMKLALPKLIAGKVKFGMVLNPQVGEIKNVDDILNGLVTELANRERWIPVLIVRNNYDAVNVLLNQLALENTMIICTDQTDTNNEYFKEIVLSDYVTAVLSEDNRSLKRFVDGIDKKIIRLDDNFKPEKRNSDYLDLPEEKFTEEHFYYLQDGYAGFSDYTPLISEWIEGGSAPYAVAIHLTYLKTKDEIWIRHFTSESNFDRANIQGKFAEAAKKAVDFLNEKEIHTVASNELRDYYNEAKYPGLGMVKKIAIKHHLEIINDSARV